MAGARSVAARTHSTRSSVGRRFRFRCIGIERTPSEHSCAEGTSEYGSSSYRFVVNHSKAAASRPQSKVGIGGAPRQGGSDPILRGGADVRRPPRPRTQSTNPRPRRCGAPVHRSGTLAPTGFAMPQFRTPAMASSLTRTGSLSLCFRAAVKTILIRGLGVRPVYIKMSCNRNGGLGSNRSRWGDRENPRRVGSPSWVLLG
jgi:hypothetical protein